MVHIGQCVSDLELTMVDWSHWTCTVGTNIRTETTKIEMQNGLPVMI